MPADYWEDSNILVTGGTSGLGLELVRILLKNGYRVVATGRNEVEIDDPAHRFNLCKVDFDDLKEVARTFTALSRQYHFRAVVNNAGILSPPAYTQTKDGLEYTFQVNFLTHLLINEIIIGNTRDGDLLRIATVTSPVYRIADLSRSFHPLPDAYRPVQAYAASKFCLAMMNDILTSKHGGQSFQCFSFDPGTFSSGIYRMQKRWFREMYQIAAPFMRDPSKVANALADLLTGDATRSGLIYDIRKRSRLLQVKENIDIDAFIKSCYTIIEKYL
jgi:NAD(P)-dependent dehydrogenase (short-subunit alcohol dehydrogenase family)